MTEDEMLKDLATADAAGDTQLANTIAARIKSARTGGAAPAAPAPPAPGSPAASSSMAAAPPAAPPEPVSSVPGKLWNMAKNLPENLIVDLPQALATGIVDTGKSTVLGARQLAAAAGLGDKEALKQQAAALEEEQKGHGPVAKTAKVATDIGLSFTPMGATAKTLALIPKLPKYLEAAKAVLPSVVSGATMDLLDPSKDYDAAHKALAGGGGAGLFDAALRVPGALYRKLAGGGGEAAKEAAGILNQAGLPRQTLATQQGAGMTQQLTDALGMVTGVGYKALENRNKNLDWVTQLASEQAGMGPKGAGVTQITQAVRDANARRLDDAANMFRQGPDVPLPNVAPELQAKMDEVANFLKATAQEGKAKPVQAAIESATPAPSPLIMPPGVPPPPRPPVTVTADEAMDLRRAASRKANSANTAGNTDEAELFRAVRDAYDKAIKSTLPKSTPAGTVVTNAEIPHTAEGFDKWRQQFGDHRDVVAAYEKGTEGGRLIPQNIHSVIAKTGGMKDVAPVMEAANLNITRPPSGWNRAMMTSLLVGTPLGAGVLGTFAPGGDLSVGGTAGAGLAAAMIKGLTHTPQTPAQREAFRKMLVAAGIGIGT